jgi:hypothetical protein
MDQPPPPADLLPPRVSWFAVWRWKRRKRIALSIAIVLVGYPLSIGPALMLAGNRTISPTFVATAYRPITYWCWRLPYVGSNVIRDYMHWWDPGEADFLLEEHLDWELRRRLQRFRDPTPKY